METVLQQLTETEEGLKAYQQERLILEVTELICKHLAEKEVSRTELAKRLGKTKGWITQLLDGRANMTIRTIADVFTALKCELGVNAKPLSIDTKRRKYLASRRDGSGR